MNGLRAFVLLGVVVGVFLPTGDLYAQGKKKPKKVYTINSGYDRVVMPTLKSTSVIIDDDEIVPLEPNMGEVKFLEPPASNSLSERVNRMMQSITLDTRPEYDHYGYEVRRYMSRIGNIRGFSDRAYLFEQIKNVKNAKIVATYWARYLNAETTSIESLIENNHSVSPSVRSQFKKNDSVIKSFMIDLNAWIDTNEKLLTYIYKTMASYEVHYPEIIITTPEDRIEFYNLQATRQTKLVEIQEYTPFAMMVY